MEAKHLYQDSDNLSRKKNVFQHTYRQIFQVHTAEEQWLHRDRRKCTVWHCQWCGLHHP